MAPLFVIAAELALIGWLIRNSYYAADDWIMFSVVKSYGFSWRTLSFNLYNHFAPVEWLLHLFVQDVSPLDYGPGLAIILVLCAGMLLALWWTLSVLEAPRPVVLGGIIVIGTSPFLVNSALWFGQAVFIPLFLTGMLLVVGFFVRWCRYGRRRDAISALVVFAVSLLVGEIPLLLLPSLVILRYLVVDRPGWKNLPGAIWRDRWVWVPFFALGAVFAWFFRTHYYGPEPKPTPGQLFGVLAYGFVRLWRGTVGIPIASGHTWVRVLSDAGVIVTGLGILFICFRSRNVARACFFFAVYFVLKQAALAFGVAGKYGANAVTSDAQYYIDLLVFAVLAGRVGNQPWTARSPERRESRPASRCLTGGLSDRRPPRFQKTQDSPPGSSRLGRSRSHRAGCPRCCHPVSGSRTSFTEMRPRRIPATTSSDYGIVSNQSTDHGCMPPWSQCFSRDTWLPDSSPLTTSRTPFSSSRRSGGHTTQVLSWRSPTPAT